MVVSVISQITSDPYKLGVYAGQEGNVSIGSHFQANDLEDRPHIFVVAPNTAKAVNLPVYVFWTASAGRVPSQAYYDYLTHVASHGVFVVSMDFRPNMTSPTYQQDVAVLLEKTLPWLKTAEFSNICKAEGLVSVSLDWKRLIIGGHSAGGHTVTQAMQDQCNGATGLVLISPVDGFIPLIDHPVPYPPIYVVHPPLKVTFQTPLLHIENIYDPVPDYNPSQYTNQTTNHYPACAPDDLSNDRFFNAWRGPAWQINATKYGHMDILDAGERDNVARAFDLVCEACNQTLVSNKPYIALSGGATVAFIAMLQKGDGVAQSYLENKALMPTTVILQMAKNSYRAPYVGFCNSVRGGQHRDFTNRNGRGSRKHLRRARK